MIDPVNSQDKVVVVAMMNEKEHVSIYQSSRDVSTFLNHFQNLIPLYQLERAKKSFISFSNFKFLMPTVLLTLIFLKYWPVHY